MYYRLQRWNYRIETYNKTMKFMKPQKSSGMIESLQGDCDFTTSPEIADNVFEWERRQESVKKIGAHLNTYHSLYEFKYF